MVQAGTLIHTLGMVLEDTMIMVTGTMTMVMGITGMVHQLMTQQATAEEQAMKDQTAIQALEVMGITTIIAAIHQTDMMLMGTLGAITGT